MRESQFTPRLSLVDPDTAPDDVAHALRQLPMINVFRALANAETLYPPFAEFMGRLFKPLELDAATERMIVLHVVQQSDCFYAWRQNVVVARSVGVTEEQILALQNGDVAAPCFAEEQKAAFAFAGEFDRSLEVSNATFSRARDCFSDRALTEIMFVVGTYMFVSRVLRTGHVPLDDKPAASPQ